MVTGYSVEAIAKRMEEIKAAAAKKQASKNFTKIKWFKAELGKNSSEVEKEIRFLWPKNPIMGEPFFTVKIYDELKDGFKKCYSPSTFGMPDLVEEWFEANRKTKWDIAKKLRPREVVYAYMIDRTAEQEGGQFMEMKPEHKEAIYKELMGKNFKKMNPFDTTNGNNFTLTISPMRNGDGSYKMWGEGKDKKVCKKLSFSCLLEQSPLSEDPAKVKEWTDSAPDFFEHFKGMLLKPEDLKARLDAYIERKLAEQMKEEDENSTEDGLVQGGAELSDEEAKKEAEAFFASTDVNLG